MSFSPDIVPFKYIKYGILMPTTEDILNCKASQINIPDQVYFFAADNLSAKTKDDYVTYLVKYQSSLPKSDVVLFSIVKDFDLTLNFIQKQLYVGICRV